MQARNSNLAHFEYETLEWRNNISELKNQSMQNPLIQQAFEMGKLYTFQSSYEMVLPV